MLCEAVRLLVRLSLDVHHTARQQSTQDKWALKGKGGELSAWSALALVLLWWLDTSLSTVCSHLQVAGMASRNATRCWLAGRQIPAPGVSAQHAAQVVPDRLLVG